MFCTKCGFNLPDDVKFCPNCGTTVENTQSEQQTAQTDAAQNTQFYQSDVIDEDVKSLIGTKQEYYVPKFSQMKQLNKKMTWNWPAFLVAPAWFFYRKMYVYGIGMLILNIIMGELVDSVLSIAISAVVAVFANYIYMDWLEKLSLQMKSMTPTVKEAFIKEKGGTSGMAILVCVVINLLITTVLGLIFY